MGATTMKTEEAHVHDHSSCAGSSKEKQASGIQQAVSAVARNAAASTMGASVVALLVTPLDVAKIRMQAHVCPVGGSMPCPDPAHPRGTVDMMRRIVRADGIRGLWRGLTPTLILAVPTTGFYFTLYEAMRSHCGMTALVAGASARVVSATLASPLELARTQLQAGTHNSRRSGARDVLNVLKNVRNSNGTLALWRGLFPTILRDAPFSAIYWNAYERLRYSDDIDIAALKNPLAAGIVAGSTAAFCTIPADVVKTRRQAGNVAGTPETVSSIVQQIQRTEGIRGFFRGVVPRMVKIAPSSAIMMGSYEMFRTWFAI